LEVVPADSRNWYGISDVAVRIRIVFRL
jgi:hypothetical protein